MICGAGGVRCICYIRSLREAEVVAGCDDGDVLAEAVANCDDVLTAGCGESLRAAVLRRVSVRTRVRYLRVLRNSRLSLWVPSLPYKQSTPLHIKIPFCFL